MTEQEAKTESIFDFLTPQAKIIPHLVKNPTISVDELAKEVGYTPRYISTNLKKLHKAGILKTTKGGGRDKKIGGRTYEIDLEASIESKGIGTITVIDLINWVEILQAKQNRNNSPT